MLIRIGLRRAVSNGSIILAFFCFHAELGAAGFQTQTTTREQITTLISQASEAFNKRDQEGGDKIIEAMLAFADNNHLGADPSLSNAAMVILRVADPEKRLDYIDRVIRIVARDNPNAQMNGLCSLLLSTEMPILLNSSQGTGAFNDLERRFGACKGLFEQIRPRLSPVIAMSQGDYSGILSQMKQRRDALKNGVVAEDATAPGIVFFSLLDGDVPGARSYLPQMETDYRLQMQNEKSTMPGLDDLRQFEGLDSGTGFGAISLAAFYNLNFGRDDEELEKIAMQLILAAKSTGVDDARVTLDLLKNSQIPTQVDLAKRLTAEYGYSAGLWAKLNILRQPVPGVRGRNKYFFTVLIARLCAPRIHAKRPRCAVTSGETEPGLKTCEAAALKPGRTDR